LLPHQKTIRQTKNKLYLYAKVSYEEEILKVVKHWIPNIRIISPINLRDKLRDVLVEFLDDI